MHEIRHPIPGEIMATLASHPRTLALARYLIRSPDLRMREQILSRTDPVPPPSDRPITASSFHIDAPFLREEFEATPRQVYWQSILYCSDVAPGQANIRLIPRSHHRTLAANRDPAEAARQRFTEAANINWPCTESPGIEGISTGDAIEVSAKEGTLVLFNPMLLRERNPPPLPLCVGGLPILSAHSKSVAACRRLLPQPHSDLPLRLLRELLPPLREVARQGHPPQALPRRRAGEDCRAPGDAAPAAAGASRAARLLSY